MTDTKDPEWLTPAEVAALFRVETKAVARWSDAGKLECIRTPGGTRRYRRRYIEALLNEGASRDL